MLNIYFDTNVLENRVGKDLLSLYKCDMSTNYYKIARFVNDKLLGNEVSLNIPLKLCKLGRGKYAHQKCFFKCYYKGDIDKVPPHTYVDAEPSFDRQLKDFSNLEYSEKYKLTFSIETVSKRSIHLCMRESNYSRKNNFYLSYDQCVELISKVRQRLQELEDSVIGICCHCERPIHADQDSFVLHDGAKLHRGCLEEFIASSEASAAQFPASHIRSRDVFGRAYYWR